MAKMPNRGDVWLVDLGSDVRFLKAGAFDAQNIITIPTVKLIRRLGTLPDAQLTTVARAVRVLPSPHVSLGYR